jgi:hypothetical protein
VSGGQRLQLGFSGCGEAEADDPLILRIAGPLHQAGAHGPIDQLDGAVVAQQQVLGDIADRRRATVSPDGEEELMLRSGDPDRLRLLLAPPQEAAEPVTKAQEALEVALGEGP